jgi:antibiotic biosynthesis monooxygenase (ABM) superfamily enzyme
MPGWAAGIPTDSEETLRFAEMTGVRLLLFEEWKEMVLAITIGHWISGWPMILSSLIFNACIVTGLTWFLMPFLTRLFKPWLYPNTDHGVSRP